MISRIAVIFILLLFWSGKACGQENIVRLQKKVYDLCNSMKYEDAQAEIHNFAMLHQKHPELYRAYIILSHTYKRVYDYDLAREALHKASLLADRSENQDHAENHILYETALVEFDIQSYDKSRELMDMIDEEERALLGPGAHSNLIMQEAYLDLRAKDYSQAEQKFLHARKIKQQSDPCNLPMVLGKMMELYGASGDSQALTKTFERSNAIADSCGILKYKIYNYQLLRKIYHDLGEYELEGQTHAEVQKLEAVYKAEEHRLFLRAKARERQREQVQLALDKKTRMMTFYGIIAGLLLGLLLLVLAYLRYLHQRHLQMTTQNLEMREEIDQFLRSNPNLEAENETIDPPELQKTVGIQGPNKQDPNLEKLLQNLTERQSEIAVLILQGQTNKEISQQLYISENTVKYHTRNIYQTLDIKNRRELFLISKN